MRFYTNMMDAPIRLIAACSKRTILKAGRSIRIERNPNPDGGSRGFESREKMEEFLREHRERTDFHIRAAQRLCKRLGVDCLPPPRELVEHWVTHGGKMG